MSFSTLTRFRLQSLQLPSFPFQISVSCHARNLQSASKRTLLTSAQSNTRPPSFAFAFDIDGVLLHAKTPIPGATKALNILRSSDVDFLLLTNGGGLSESARVAELSTALSFPISTSQFVQSHTPFKRRANSEKTILVLGGKKDNCRQVAHEYGFKNVLIPADIVAENPAAVPFSDTGKVRDYARPVKDGTKIDEIYVFNDPRDWATDVQVTVDILLSENGVVGTRRSISEVEKTGQSVPIYFSNPDVWWANAYHLPRLGQGGFRAALEGVWKTVCNRQLEATQIGKPHQLTYEYADEVLTEYRKSKGEEKGLERVYMVGDNPASDIQGANGFCSPTGAEWVSVLVRSGVWREGDDTAGAKMIVKDVLAAVEWAMKREAAMGAE